MQLRVDTHALDALVLELRADEKQITAAMRSTIRKMSQWVMTRVRRRASAELHMVQKIIKNRFKALKYRQSTNAASGGVWFGINPVDLKGLAPVQDASGVEAGPAEGRREFKKAFMGARPGRISAKLKGGAFVRTGSDRFPIKRVGYDINAAALKACEEAINPHEFEAQFIKVFTSELKWRTQTYR